jgi:uroporphyrinogen-III synthase
MKILITRPEPDASRLADHLQKSGFETFVEPLMVVGAVAEEGKALSFGNVQAVAFTSANGVRALARASAERQIPVFTVGAATAAAAREAGFAFVHVAGGDVDHLASQIGTTLDPHEGRIVHVAGKVVAGDLQGMLSSFGFEVERHVLYGTKAREAFSPELLAELAARRISAVTLYSPRTARVFAALVKKAGQEASCQALTCYVLSENVAGALAGLSFSALHVAEAPNEAALLELIEGD